MISMQASRFQAMVNAERFRRSGWFLRMKPRSIESNDGTGCSGHVGPATPSHPVIYLIEQGSMPRISPPPPSAVLVPPPGRRSESALTTRNQLPSRIGEIMFVTGSTTYRDFRRKYRQSYIVGYQWPHII